MRVNYLIMWEWKDQHRYVEKCLFFVRYIKYLIAES